MSLHLFKPPYDLDQRVWAKFARLNKQSTLQEYHEQCATLCGYDWYQCRIDRIMALSPRAYDELSWTLLEPQDGFAEMGGTASDSVYDSDGDLKFEDEAQREDWIRLSYCRVILACAPGREPFVIDPQGYPYARYVGLDIRTEPPVARHPGEWLGRWVYHDSHGAAFVIDNGAKRFGGRVPFRVLQVENQAAINGVIRPRRFMHIVLAGRQTAGWRWAFSDPDSEKMSPERIKTLCNRLLELEETGKKSAMNIRKALAEESKARRSAYLRRKPKWAQTAIVAELWKNNDAGPAIPHYVSRRVVLLWSRYTRECFNELREAAKSFGPTARLASLPGTEREFPSRDATGFRRFLAAETFKGDGWIVRKTLCSYIRERPVEWDAPELMPASAARTFPASLPDSRIPQGD